MVKKINLDSLGIEKGSIHRCLLDVNALNIIREELDFLLADISDARIFCEYADSNLDGIDVDMPAAQMIQSAYPVLQFDTQTNDYQDNRVQQNINAVLNFVTTMEQMEQIDENMEIKNRLLFATQIYSLLSSIENSLNNILQAAEEDRMDFVEPLKLLCDGLEDYLQTYGLNYLHPIIKNKTNKFACVTKFFSQNNQVGVHSSLNKINLLAANQNEPDPQINKKITGLKKAN